MTDWLQCGPPRGIHSPRVCRECGHVHEIGRAIYCCEGCGVWGQDFWEDGLYDEALTDAILKAAQDAGIEPE